MGDLTVNYYTEENQHHIHFFDCLVEDQKHHQHIHRQEKKSALEDKSLNILSFFKRNFHLMIM